MFGRPVAGTHRHARAVDAIEWARSHGATGEPKVEQDRPWARTTRVGELWLKECRAVQIFEPRLTASLHARWPDRVVDVVAHDDERGWLLTRDAGTPVGAFGNAPDAWLATLPLYAELQRGEAAHVDEHLADGVPDLRRERLPEEYERFFEAGLPLADEQRERLQTFAPRFAELCDELPDLASVDHGDLNIGNVYALGDRVLVTDWGDAGIAHPFFSLVVTARWVTGADFERARDAYLEPWGGDDGTVELALRVGRIAHCFTWFRHRDHMPGDFLVQFDEWFPRVLEQAVAQT
jgi:phosphotransferase family enzyme